MGTIGSAYPRISNKNHENSFGDFVKCSEVLHLSVTANQMTWKNMFNSCCFWELNWTLPRARMLIVYHVKSPTNIAVSERASYWSDRRFKGPMVVHFILPTHCSYDDDVIKWKHFPHYWSFMRGIGEFHSQRTVTRSFDVFFDLRLNKRLSKQLWGWWLETPSH